MAGILGPEGALDRAKKLVQRIAGNKSGTTAITFGLVLIPAIFLVGAAIDYGRAYGDRSESQHIADAAALFGVSQFGDSTLSAQDIEEATRNYIEQALAQRRLHGTSPPTPTVSVDGQNREVQVDLNGSVPTIFMSLAQIDSMDVAASATAAQAKAAAN